MPLQEFEIFASGVRGCAACPSMNGCTRVMSRANGPVDARVIFVGEAPGRLGADRTAIPFHGDKAGDNFQRLLEAARLTRNDIFVTNAVLCNPRDDNGNNRPPSKTEIVNCAGHLNELISILNPDMVVTLGAVALEAARIVSAHQLTISSGVRTSNKWHGRLLVPLYHPGARAMVHRSFANQLADYYFVGELVRRIGRPKRPSRGARGTVESWSVVRAVLELSGSLSLFQLHKALYLIDYRMRSEYDVPATDFYYVRQKDGPYCVELGGKWYDKFPDLKIIKSSNPRLIWDRAPLLSALHGEVPLDIYNIVNRTVREIANLSESELKTKVYLTRPMKAILRVERTGAYALNYPIFDTSIRPRVD